MKFQLLISFCIFISSATSQFYEDKRCRCICPSPAAVFNASITDRKLYTGNVPPNKCNCDGVILPLVGDELKGREQEFCPRCECKYERRNTTVIMVVVIMLLWVMTLLAVYMGFIICLDPWINKKKAKVYRERGVEEDYLLLKREDVTEITNTNTSGYPFRDNSRERNANALLVEEPEE